MRKLKDTVSLSAQGSSLRFTIVPAMRKDLELNFGDSIQIEIFKIIKKGEPPLDVSEFMSRKVIKIGGSSIGASIKSNIIKRYQLKAGDEIGIEINLKRK